MLKIQLQTRAGQNLYHNVFLNFFLVQYRSDIDFKTTEKQPRTSRKYNCSTQTSEKWNDQIHKTSSYTTISCFRYKKCINKSMFTLYVNLYCDITVKKKQLTSWHHHNNDVYQNIENVFKSHNIMIATYQISRRRKTWHSHNYLLKNIWEQPAANVISNNNFQHI